MDWENSSAHLDFLSYFLEPRQSQTTDKFQKWAEPLGESVEVALKRFLEIGMLQRADTINHLIAIYNATELKRILKERGLPQSGTKDVLAARLADKDAHGVQQLISGHLVLICSEKGKSIAQAYKAREEHRRKEAQDLTQNELSEGHYREAASTLARYEANCVFQRGMNMSWKDYDTSRDEEILHNVFTRIPKLAIKKGWDRLPNVNIIAGMIHLWGNTERAGITCDRETNNAAQAFLTHAIFLNEIDGRHRAGIKYVSITTCNDDSVCNACKQAAKRKRYSLTEVPELPLAECQDDMGCRCWLL